MLADPLRLILQRLELNPAVFCNGEVDRQLSAHLQVLLGLRLLREISPATSWGCEQCASGSLLSVQYADDRPSGLKRAFVCCPQCGVLEVDLPLLRRWEADLQRLLEIVSTFSAIRANLTEIIPECVWKLGVFRLADKRGDVYFARNCVGAEQLAVNDELSRQRKSLVFVLTDVTASRLAQTTGCISIALESALLLEEEHIKLDSDYVKDCLVNSGVVGNPGTKKPAKKRASRTAKIEALSHQMIAHLVRARDHAFASQEQTGVAELLPRLRQYVLADLAGVSVSDTSRCLNDPAARELRLLWKTATDLSAIMTFRPSKSGA